MIWVPLELKILAEKVGFLSPEVAIGWRVGDLFRRKLIRQGKKIKDHMVVSYNGLPGNQVLSLMGFRLRVEDLGEHVYSLCDSQGQPHLMVSVRLRHLLPEEGFIQLEKRIAHLEAEPAEREEYLLALDRWVSQIILASDGELFRKEKADQDYLCLAPESPARPIS